MKTFRATLHFRIEYGILRGLIGFLPRLSHAARRRLARLIAVLWYYVLPYRRQTVRRNLMKAFPGQPAAWHKEVQRRCLRTIAQIYLDAFAGYQLENRRFQQMLHPVDRTPVDTALKEGKGVLILSFHFGNWEMVADWLARQNYPLAAIAARMNNPLADQLITAIRTHNGIRILPKGRQHTVKTFRFLKADHLLYMISDQNAGRKGAWVKFFGQWSSSFRGPALFAIRTRCPVLLATCLPDRQGRYHIHFERFTPEISKDRDEDDIITGMIQAYTRYFEKLIRRHPDQYYWIHRRWKTKVPEHLQETQN